MKAAVLYETGGPLLIEDLELPRLARGQVLVRVIASGVCHKQLEETRGKRGADPYLPHLLGHEGAGIVVETGPGVLTVKAGDRVVLSWIKGDGIESAVPAYTCAGATINAGWVTTFNEMAVVSENRVTAISSEIPFDAAALLGCAVPTGAGAMLNQADVRPGDAVAVFGVGGIGLNAVQAAAGLGAGKIIAIDVAEDRLARACEFGATDLIDARSADPVAEVRRLTGGSGADIAFEASGKTAVMEQAYEAAREVTGVCIIAGVPPGGARISIDSYQLNRGKRIMGTAGGGSNPSADFPRFADMYLSGRLNLDELITHRFRLEEVNEALAALERGEVGRAIIWFGEGSRGSSV